MKNNYVTKGDVVRGESFAEHVRLVVARIPEGKTLSYGEVARRAGNPRAARAVGTILNKNHNPLIPCHRVIRSDGTSGGYNRGAERKRTMLEKEGAFNTMTK